MFFDNLQVIQTRGPLLQESHYSPWGLELTGISFKAAGKPENKYKYNGKEQQHQEFSDGSGLECYDTYFMQLDVQLGRWNQIDPKCEIAINPNVEENENIEDESEVGGLERMSPYMSIGDEPIKHNDPKGDVPCCISVQEVWNQTQHIAAESDPEIGRPLVELAGTVAIIGALAWDIWTELGNRKPVSISPPKSPTYTPTKISPPNAVTAVHPPVSTTLYAHGQKKQSTGSTKKSGDNHMRQYKNNKKGNKKNNNQRKGAEEKRLKNKPIN